MKPSSLQVSSLIRAKLMLVRYSSACIWAMLLSALCPLIAHAAALELAIRPCFAGSPLSLDSLKYENGAQETLSVSRLSFLLSGFAVERDNGEWVELDERFAWIDLAKQRLNTRLDDVPVGKYRALRFYLGPDAKTNAADPSQRPADHPLNINFNGLYWSMQGGYIFLAVEGHYRSKSGELLGYSYHLARDGNRTRVSMALPLDLTADTAVMLDLDLANLLNAPRALSFAKDGETTHSRDGDPVAAALVANLPGAFRVRQVLSAVPMISRPSAVKPLYLPAKFTPYHFTMSGTFPIPELPRDNPLLDERVALGKRLFNEPALSRDASLSCASCHDSTAGFSDKRRFSVGVDGQLGSRHAMPLMNLAWKSSYFWDGRALSLRAQALMPIQDPTEMAETLDHVIAKLKSMPEYPSLFETAFGSPEITAEKLGLALENFLLTLTAFDSKFDRAMHGKEPLTEDEKRGFELFMTEYDPRTGQQGADCFHCHGGPLFSDHQFHNNGLKTDAADTGRHRVTKTDADLYKFATPSLRNVGRTAPYMHDGRFTTLEQVVEHYSSGLQRSATLDPNLAKHPEGGLKLSKEDQRALVAFLRSLSD